MTRASEIVAATIKARTLDALQAAEEMHGPDYPEYIEMMRELAADCTQRAETAQRQYNAERCVRLAQEWAVGRKWTAEKWETGGGCTAIGIQAAGKSSHWLITEAGGPDAPTNPCDPCTLGWYSAHGEGWITFDCANLADALTIIGKSTYSSEG
jgi:hypothetical protein